MVIKMRMRKRDRAMEKGIKHAREGED